MTRKQKQQPYRGKSIKPSMKRHLKALGLTSEWAYFVWCTRHNLRSTLDKTRQEMAAECQLHEREQVNRRSHLQLHRNPERFLREVCLGEILPEAIQRPGWREVAEAIARSSRKCGRQQRQQLAEFLVGLHRKSKFVFEVAPLNGPSSGQSNGRMNSQSNGQTVYFMQALVTLYAYRDRWFRPVETWTPTTHNLHGQFASLLNHLFVQYSPVPAFMNTVWFRTDKKAKLAQESYLHLAAGYNIRKADLTGLLDEKMTKKMAQYFVQAPDGCRLESALNWAHIHDLGGDQRLFEAVSASRIGDNTKRREFWTSVIRFFIEHPMLDRAYVGPIVDYLHAQKFAVQEFVTGPGVVERVLPPQPNLAMRGRTPTALLKQVEQWHGNLAKSSGAENLFFRRSGIAAFRKRTGENKADAWQIRELLSGADLVLESRKMQHCVSSYARACAAGQCSIWALEYVTPKGTTKHQTIEVRPDKTIVQCRGKRNRYPTRAELGVIKQWCHAAGLSLSCYIAERTED